MSKRIIASICVFVILFVGVCGRLAYVCVGGDYAVNDSYNSKTFPIDTLYTTIYASDGERLNNNTKSIVAIIRPNEKCMRELLLLFNNDSQKEITKELSKGNPVIRKIDKYAKTTYIKTVEVTCENVTDMPCRHLIDKACSGLETITDKELGALSVNFSVDAVGRILSGDEGEIINKNYNSADGVIVSINSKLQSIGEESSTAIEKGCVVIMDTETSQIKACVSRGNDYINRAASTYTVGSVFKLVIAATALENNIDLTYKCTGKIIVGDTVFHCQSKHKHGEQKIDDALANSCNCYFVNLALKLGADKIYETAIKFGYCKDISLYTYNSDNFTVKAGSFPLKSELQSQGQLALLGFGQGKLTDTPIHFASVISCIANGGEYYCPTLSLQVKNSITAISSKTAEKLRKYMKNVVDNGTGKNAYYDGKTAGKTATAQSGIYVDGEEILNTWFAGFYPYEKPKYAIVVMCEDGKSGAEDCCPVFRTIVEKIEEMSYNNSEK